MHKSDNPTMPPPAVLAALRRPRRVQLHDPAVKALLAQWKRRGRAIEYMDLNEVADLIGVKNPKASTRKKIVAAVEGAGIEINNLDATRRWIAETGCFVSLNGWGAMRSIEEARWRWPEKWDRDQRHQRETCVRVKRGRLEYILERERVKPGDRILPWRNDEERWR